MATSPVTSTSPSPAAQQKLPGLAEDFNSFLRLLTTQLAHQDPLAPMDPNQFTSQLVQFSSVEQAIKTNTTLAQMLAILQAGESARALDYIGTEVEAPGDTLRLGEDGGIVFRYRVAGQASEVTVRIYDHAGRLAYEAAGSILGGDQVFAWDGHGQDGLRQPEGAYRIEVEAKDAAGKDLAVSTKVRGIVDAVERHGDQLFLSLGGHSVPMSAITRVSRGASA